ncbi:MAG: carboxymuconolactone decarboxylase family protein [Gemmatimonadaceae bacterium]
MQRISMPCTLSMSDSSPGQGSVGALDRGTQELVRLAALIAVGGEDMLRSGMSRAAERTDHVWVEELILQSYLFAGFPRALNAAREWRRISGRSAPLTDDGEDYGDAEGWRQRGEVTCSTVYGEMYTALRRNIRLLHPALDAWMVVEGYGKVLSRPGLDLKRRELCIVAVCAVTQQWRQLHSHFHGAVNAGAVGEEVLETLSVASEFATAAQTEHWHSLWARVRRAAQS